MLIILSFSSFAAGATLWTNNGAVVCSAESDQDPYYEGYYRCADDGSGGTIFAWLDGRGGTYAQKLDKYGIARWQKDGVLIDSASNRIEIIKDGYGGALIVGGYGSGLLLMRINSFGSVLWQRVICTTISNYHISKIADIGGGKSVITWTDTRNASYDIYAQKVDNYSGLAEWTSNGIAVCTTEHEQQYPEIASVGSGNVIITWHEWQAYPLTLEVHAQKLNSSGITQWPAADGITVSGTSEFAYWPEIVSDGSGGAVISWIQGINMPAGISAQRVNGSGNIVWISTPEGVLITNYYDSWNYQYHDMISDGSGGVILAYNSRSPQGTLEAFLQRVRSDGSVWQQPNGIPMTTKTSYSWFPNLVSDGSGGAIVAWEDARRSGDNIDIYAQRVNINGVTQWMTNGITLCAAPYYKFYPRLSGDGLGHATVMWLDCRKGEGLNDSDLYAQKVYDYYDIPDIALITVNTPTWGDKLVENSPYFIQWQIERFATTDAYIRLSTNEGQTWDTLIAQRPGVIGTSSWEWTPPPYLISNECMISIEVGGPGGWNYGNSGIFSIIHTPPLVTVEAPNSGEVITVATYEVKWKATDELGVKSDGITIKYSVNSGESWTLIADHLANNGSYSWSVPDTYSTRCRIMVQAENITGSVGSDTSNANFSIIRSLPVKNLRNRLSYTTIQGALDAATTLANDTLQCADIIFYERINWPNKSNITLQGLGKGLTVIDAQAAGRVIYVANQLAINIKNLTIQNGMAPNSGGGIYLGQWNSILNLEGVEFYYNYTAMNTGDYYGGAIYSPVCTINARNCSFDSNFAYRGGAVGYGGTWNIDNCTFSRSFLRYPNVAAGGVFHSVTLTANNCIFNNNSSPYYAAVGYGCSGTINNCVFNNSSASQPGCVFTGSNLTIRNSIFLGYSGTDQPFSGGSGTVKYCNVQGGNFGSYTDGGHNIGNDPLFDSTFHLRPGSPCINTGTSEGAPAFDMEGNPRPGLGGYDMGVFESGHLNDVWVSYATGSDSGGDGSVGNPYQTIGYAIGKAYTGGTVHAFGGVYPEYNITWPGTFFLTLKASLETSPVTIDAGGISPRRIFSVNNTVDMFLEGITLKNGRINERGGGIFLNCSNTNLWLKNVTFISCTAEPGGVNPDRGGGAVGSINNTNYIFAENSRFIGCKGYWGGVAEQGNWSAKNCYFRENVGIFVGGTQGKTYWTIENCTFESNGGHMFGTANAANVEVVCRVKNSLFKDNAGVFSGGVQYVTDSIFKNNRVPSGHGGVAIGATMTATNCSFIGNSASGSGGVAMGGKWKVFNSLFIGNYATYGGVTEYSSPYQVGTFEVTNCTFLNNYSNQGAFKDFMDSRWPLKLTNCIIWGNNDQFFNVNYGTLINCDVQNLAECKDPGQNVNITTIECIQKNPWFVSTSEPYDLRMALESGCIDSGTFEGAPPLDMLGVSRPQPDTDPFMNFDMGAYEQAGLLAPVIVVKKPNGGEWVLANRKYYIQWEITEHLNTDVNIRLSRNNGQTYDTFIATVPGVLGVSTYEWTPTLNLVSTECRISIEAGGPDGWRSDASDAKFSIRNPDVWVSTTGSNTSGAGTVDSPYQTIRFALTQVGTTGAINCFGGIYPEYNIIWPASREVTLRASSETSPVTLDAGAVLSRTIIIVDKTINLTLEGITLQRAYSKASYAGGAFALVCSNTNLWLKNVTIQSCTADAGDYWCGGVYSQYDTNRIFAENSKFLSNSGYWASVGQNGIWNVNNCYFSGTGSGRSRIAHLKVTTPYLVSFLYPQKIPYSGIMVFPAV